MEQTPAGKAIFTWFEQHPNQEYHNNEIAESVGYSSTTVSNCACNMHRAGELKRVGKGRWLFPKELPKDDPWHSDSPGNPASVAAADHIIESRQWTEIKVTRAIQSPAGYTYHKITDRNGRTGIVVWDE